MLTEAVSRLSSPFPRRDTARHGRPLAERLDVIAERGVRQHRDMAYLAARDAPAYRTGAPSRRDRRPSRACTAQDVRPCWHVAPVPPNTFAIATCGAAAAGSPSGRSSTARRCCSNWEVPAPFDVQCPLLCGRIASSLTSSPAAVRRIDREKAGHPELSATSRASPRSRPRGPRRGRARGDHLAANAVALHSLHDREAAPCSCGERATSAASSRSNLTCSSAISASPFSASIDDPGRLLRCVADPHPPPVVAAANRLEHHGPSWSRRIPHIARAAAGAYRGHGTPSPVSLSRIDQLVLREPERRAPGPQTARPPQRGQVRAGTCSWSNVTTSQPAAKARRSATE